MELRLSALIIVASILRYLQLIFPNSKDAEARRSAPTKADIVLHLNMEAKCVGEDTKNVAKRVKVGVEREIYEYGILFMLHWSK